MRTMVENTKKEKRPKTRRRLRRTQIMKNMTLYIPVTI